MFFLNLIVFFLVRNCEKEKEQIRTKKNPKCLSFLLLRHKKNRRSKIQRSLFYSGIFLSKNYHLHSFCTSFVPIYHYLAGATYVSSQILDALISQTVSLLFFFSFSHSFLFNLVPIVCPLSSEHW